MPRPVTTRQIDKTTRPVTVVAMIMPNDITARHPRIVGRRPILSATPPSTIEPMAMPINSIESTMPSRGAVDAPFRSDAGRREADREDVEPVERVQGDRDADHRESAAGSSGLGDDVSGVTGHTAEVITFSVAIEQHG